MFLNFPLPFCTQCNYTPLLYSLNLMFHCNPQYMCEKKLINPKISVILARLSLSFQREQLLKVWQLSLICVTSQLLSCDFSTSTRCPECGSTATEYLPDAASEICTACGTFVQSAADDLVDESEGQLFDSGRVFVNDSIYNSGEATSSGFSRHLQSVSYIISTVQLYKRLTSSYHAVRINVIRRSRSCVRVFDKGNMLLGHAIFLIPSRRMVNWNWKGPRNSSERL